MLVGSKSAGTAVLVHVFVACAFVVRTVHIVQIPALAPNSVIILDNGPPNHDENFMRLLREAGHTPEHLPPYSPALNAIGMFAALLLQWLIPACWLPLCAEELWSALKAAMRKEQNKPGVHAAMDPYDLIRIGFDQMTIEKCREWIHDSGYC